jgi:hypothetical protein
MGAAGGWWDKSRCRGRYISDDSKIDGECCKSRLWQRNGEHRDFLVDDPDIDGDIFGYGEFRRDRGAGFTIVGGTFRLR